MANEIQLTYRSGATLTFGAYQHDGTVRTAAATAVPEIGTTGYYTTDDGNILVGDSVSIKEGVNVVAGGLYELPNVANAVWDEGLTAAAHNVSTSAGKRLRQLASPILLDGTSPDTGGTANTSTRIELDSNASAISGTYDPGTISITAGTGEGQSRQIFEYDGVNKYAYVNRDWKIIPDNTSEYILVTSTGDTHVNEGVAQGGGASTITLNALASSVDDVYIDQVVFIVAGTGADQAGVVTAYDGGTSVATVEHAWVIEPDNTSIYAMLPISTHSIAEVQAGLSTSTVTDRIAQIQESDKVLDVAAGTLTYNTKGTSTGILKKNLKDQLGAAIDSTEDIIASEVDTTP